MLDITLPQLPANGFSLAPHPLYLALHPPPFLPRPKANCGLGKKAGLGKGKGRKQGARDLVFMVISQQVANVAKHNS